MKEIKEIIAENLISLRKKNNMTQQEIAKELNYSDNTISRWERAEICPSVESLQAISKLFSVPIEFLIKENIIKQISNDAKTKRLRSIVWLILSLSLLWLGVLIAYFWIKTTSGDSLWLLFIWCIPASILDLSIFAMCWKIKVFYFTTITCLIWSLLASVYIQVLDNNIWLVFLIGIPIQIAWTIWCFVRPSKSKLKK